MFWIKGVGLGLFLWAIGFSSLGAIVVFCAVIGCGAANTPEYNANWRP